jgi:hypothetical protein
MWGNSYVDNAYWKGVTRMNECCANCRYFTVINDFEMYCTKKESYTFHLNICEKWKMRR